jgi:hypothetical protein
MIDEDFIQRAVQIRRTYLKLSNNMSLYEKKAKEVSDNLQKTLVDIDKVQEDIKNGIIKNTQDAVSKVMSILSEIESEGESLEKIVNPLNKEIEKLALEEKELYRLIKERHHDIPEEVIVREVRDRLIKENLQ